MQSVKENRARPLFRVSGEVCSEKAQNELDRVSIVRDVRLRVPAQPVDATPSSALIRQCFRGRAICLAVLDQELARAVFRLVWPSLAILAFVFNASWVRA